MPNRGVAQAVEADQRGVQRANDLLEVVCGESVAVMVISPQASMRHPRARSSRAAATAPRSVRWWAQGRS